MSQLGIESLTDEEDGRSRRRPALSCLVVLLALAVVVAIGIFAYVKGVGLIERALSPPPDYEGNGHGHVTIAIHSGDTSTQIGSTLKKADVVKSQEAFTDVAKSNPKSRTIEVGFYRLRKQMSAKNALALLLDPKSRVHKTVTIAEGKRASEILDILAEKTDFTRAQLEHAAKAKSLELPPYAHGEIEGYLFPATYEILPDTSPETLLKKMTEKFQTEAKALHLKGIARHRHQSPDELVTVASLVQAESSRPADMPKVARVIYNRLHKGMPLQFDSTVHYAAKKRGTVTTSRKMRNIESPYNTYKHKGLPPGPIDSPGAQALKAALHPAKGDWLYFVTVNLRTGKTEFAVTLKQHQRNVAEFQKYCRHSDEC